MEAVLSEMRTTKVSLLWSEGGEGGWWGPAWGVGRGQAGSLYALLWVKKKLCGFGRRSFKQKAFMQWKVDEESGVVVQKKIVYMKLRKNMFTEKTFDPLSLLHMTFKTSYFNKQIVVLLIQKSARESFTYQEFTSNH